MPFTSTFLGVEGFSFVRNAGMIPPNFKQQYDCRKAPIENLEKAAVAPAGWIY
jgi:hypothetical protein